MVAKSIVIWVFFSNSDNQTPSETVAIMVPWQTPAFMLGSCLHPLASYFATYIWADSGKKSQQLLYKFYNSLQQQNSWHFYLWQFPTEVFRYAYSIIRKVEVLYSSSTV